mgnify:CR=1 FL=1
MIQRRHRAAIIAAALGLSACAMQSSPPQPTTNYVPEPTTLSQDQIRNAMAGKSWSWASPKNKGVTIYAADGTSLVEVTGKGTTTGSWSAKDGQLCESFAPAPFLPKGAPMTCQPISGGGSSYRVGEATFTLQ